MGTQSGERTGEVMGGATAGRWSEQGAIPKESARGRYLAALVAELFQDLY